MRVTLIVLAVGTGVFAWSQAPSRADIISRATTCLERLGASKVSGTELSVEFLDGKSPTGEVEGLPYWQVKDFKTGVLLAFYADGFLFRADKPRRLLPVGNGRASVPSLWLTGESVIRSLVDLPRTVERDYLRFTDDEADLKGVPEAQGKAKARWFENVGGYATEAEVVATMAADTGEILELNAFAPKSYGPTTLKLSASEARQRAQESIARAANDRRDDRDALQLLSEDVGNLEPVVRWTRGGGAGPGADATMKYFLARELRLAYTWEGKAGLVQIDTNTGELQALVPLEARTEADQPPDPRRPSGSPKLTQRAGLSTPSILVTIIGGVVAVLGCAWWALRHKSIAR